jgi:hypothetical protein
MKALEIAIEKLKALPEDRQAYAAEVIEHIAASDDGVFRIPTRIARASCKASSKHSAASLQAKKKSIARFAVHGPEGSTRPARHRRP